MQLKDEVELYNNKKFLTNIWENGEECNILNWWLGKDWLLKDIGGCCTMLTQRSIILGSIEEGIL